MSDPFYLAIAVVIVLYVAVCVLMHLDGSR